MVRTWGIEILRDVDWESSYYVLLQEAMFTFATQYLVIFNKKYIVESDNTVMVE